MRQPALRGLLVILFLGTPLPAQEEPAAKGPEEPDFFFLTGGPYTQQKNSPQIIWASQFFWSSAGSIHRRNYTGAGRFEWGLTNRWEADFEFGGLHARERILGVTTFREGGAADLLVGVRYRLLDESFAPFTLTLGPQVIAPVASRSKRLGTGEVGYAWDVTAAKDWGGALFVTAAVNLGLAPNVPAFLDESESEFDLSQVGWAGALGWRALERPAPGGANHDVHVLLEVGGTRADEIETGDRVRSTQVLLSPGVRYGFLSPRGSLAEIGVALPMGLNRGAPNWGVIVQFQFEWPSLF